MTSKKKIWTEKRWHSLSSVKGHIERNIPGEIIKSFDGHSLTTNKATYTLYDSTLNITLKTRKSVKQLN